MTRWRVHRLMHVRPGMFDGHGHRVPGDGAEISDGSAALVVAGIRKTDVQRLVYIR